MTDRTPQTETLRGELVDVRQFSGHWCIAQVKVAGKGQVKATGKVLGCEIGDTIEMTGRWVDDARYGLQFKMQRCERLTPEGSAGMVKWIASRCPNVGEARARKMVEHFGSRLWDVIETNPLELCVIKGITHQRAGDIAAAYDQHKAERDAMVTLRDWALTEGQISQCVHRWGDLPGVLEALRADPYQLCREVSGFGFKRTDKIARAMGVPAEAPARIAAGIDHVLTEAKGAGHCYVSGGALKRMAADLLGVDPELVVDSLRAARDEGKIICDGQGGARVYSPAMHRAESLVAERIVALIERGRKDRGAA